MHIFVYTNKHCILYYVIIIDDFCFLLLRVCSFTRFFCAVFFFIMSIMSISIHEKSKSNWLQQKENILMVWVEHITAQKIHRKTFSRIFLFFIRFILFSFSTNHPTQLVSLTLAIQLRITQHEMFEMCFFSFYLIDKYKGKYQHNKVWWKKIVGWNRRKKNIVDRRK